MTEDTRDELLRTITGIVCAEFGIPADRAAPDLDLREVEGASSVKVLRAISKIERHYDIELEDEDVFGLKSINDVVGVVEKLIAQEAR
jgi:acyl carrier protein